MVFTERGARAVSSLVIRPLLPGDMAVPQDGTPLECRFSRMPTSLLMVDWNVASWMPLASLYTKLGRNSARVIRTARC